MGSSTTMSRDETIIRLHEERNHLQAQIARLQATADAAQGGIRLYRSQRVSQFRAREEDLTHRLNRIEAGGPAGGEVEAENLANEFRDASTLAESTLSQIERV